MLYIEILTMQESEKLTSGVSSILKNGAPEKPATDCLKAQVCIDVDGIAPLHRPGRTGMQIFVSSLVAGLGTKIHQSYGAFLNNRGPPWSLDCLFHGRSHENLGLNGVPPFMESLIEGFMSFKLINHIFRML